MDTSFVATNASATSAVAGGVTTAETYANNTFLQLAGGTLTGTLSAATVTSTNPYQIGTTNVLSLDSHGNVFVGSPEPGSNTGIQKTASGVSALQANTTGGQNTASGVGALQSNTSANGNTATGFAALNKNTTGLSNTAIGDEALFNKTTGDVNTAYGDDADSPSRPASVQKSTVLSAW